MKALYRSKLFAYLIQIVSTIAIIYAFFQEIPSEDLPIKQAIALESVVQIVQVAVYTWLIIQFHLSSMAAIRYLDWFITTPLMLMAFMLYLNYEADLYENRKPAPITKFIEENKKDVIVILVANTIMLLLGLMGEFGYISKLFATIAGFFALMVVFFVLYRYASKTDIGKTVFVPFVAVWSMYGIAYNFGNVNKNFTYNILDTIAKNVFGLFLTYKTFQLVDRMSFTTAVAVINSEAVVGTVVATNLNTTLIEKPRRGVNITATFTRLPEGKHGFHIHKAGDLSGKGCAGLCEHFDISNSTHGGTPGSGQRHTGDLGNIEIKEGFDQVTRRYFIEGISIEDLWGRSIVVHAGEDDLGKGGHDDSKITGHSGARIGCAVFGRGYRPERARSRSKSRPSK